MSEPTVVFQPISVARLLSILVLTVNVGYTIIMVGLLFCQDLSRSAGAISNIDTFLAFLAVSVSVIVLLRDIENGHYRHPQTTSHKLEDSPAWLRQTKGGV